MKDVYFFVLFIVIAAFGLAGLFFKPSGQPTGQSIINAFQLRTYPAPEAQGRQLRDLLNRHFRAVSGDGPSIARVELLAGGQLALIGPAEVQRGFADLLANFKTTDADDHMNFALDCWIVLGPPDLWNTMESSIGGRDIDGWLDGQAERAMTFEHLRVIGSEGGRAQISGTHFDMSPEFAKSGDQWVGELRVQGTGLDAVTTGLNTQIALTAGKPALIAGSKLNYRGDNQKILAMIQGGGQVYYIVRIDDA